MIHENGGTPNPLIGEETTHLWDEAWLGRDDLINAHAISWLSFAFFPDGTRSTLGAPSTTMCHAKNAGHANRYPIFEFGQGLFDLIRFDQIQPSKLKLGKVYDSSCNGDASALVAHHPTSLDELFDATDLA